MSFLNEFMIEFAAIGLFGELAEQWNRRVAEMIEPNSFAVGLVLGRLLKAFRRMSPTILSHTITTIHDTALPKLPSGEISVPIAAEMVASAS
jgi:hypothetical protein